MSASFRTEEVLGQLHADAIPILIGETTLAQVFAYSEQDLTREVGGFLIGVLTDEPTPQVAVHHFLPAVGAASRSRSLTFTHETWAQANRQAEQRFAGERIVGWQHTHPNLGVFLSAHDLFIHRHFFCQPWQIALVVDPGRREFGFFQWRSGEIVGCGFKHVRTAARSIHSDVQRTHLH